MQTKIHTNKSIIRIKRNTLRTDSVHADVELWGILPNTKGLVGDPMRDARLLVFATVSGHPDKVVLSYLKDTSKQEIISAEEFSILIWSLRIVPQDGVELSKEDQDKVYQQIVQTRKDFVSVNGLLLN